MKEILVNEYEMTDRLSEATKLHAEIMASGQTAAAALLEFCKGLKRMRDDELYKELGFSKFEDYTEKKAGIKSRMAYHYISVYENLGSTFLQSNANLGITKLSLLTKLSPEDRNSLAYSGEIDDVSVRELEERIKELTGANEQLSLINAEAEKRADRAGKSEAELSEKLKRSQQEAEELRRQLSEKEESSTLSDEEKDEIKKTAEREAKEKYDLKLSENRKRSEFEKEKAVREAEEAAKNAAKADAGREYEECLAALTEEKERFKAELSAVRKKERIETDGKTAEFQFRFRAIQGEVKASLALLDEMTPETAEKLSGGLKKYFEIIIENIEKR